MIFLEVLWWCPSLKTLNLLAVSCIWFLMILYKFFLGYLQYYFSSLISHNTLIVNVFKLFLLILCISLPPHVWFSSLRRIIPFYWSQGTYSLALLRVWPQFSQYNRPNSSLSTNAQNVSLPSLGCLCQSRFLFNCLLSGFGWLNKLESDSFPRFVFSHLSDSSSHAEVPGGYCARGADRRWKMVSGLGVRSFLPSQKFPRGSLTVLGVLLFLTILILSTYLHCLSLLQANCLSEDRLCFHGFSPFLTHDVTQ